MLGDALAASGVALVALGLEPGPRRERALFNPRYDAMEAYFDIANAAGRTMMRSTAAFQVNLDLGDVGCVAERWQAAHDLGPVLAATFANSPIGDDGPTGYRSTRLAVWNEIDPFRTAPAATQQRLPRRVGRLRARGPRHARAHVVRLPRARARPLQLRRVDRPRSRPRVADARGPRVPPHDALPAGAATRVARAADARRRARRPGGASRSR